MYENVNRIKRAVQPFLVLDPADLNRLRAVFELPSFDCWPFYQGHPFLAWQALLTYKKGPWTFSAVSSASFSSSSNKRLNRSGGEGLELIHVQYFKLTFIPCGNLTWTFTQHCHISFSRVIKKLRLCSWMRLLILDF